jgi:parallel beta-helix repeat protein
VWTRECNVIQVIDCNGGGDLWDRAKGILFWSTADSKVVGCDIGGVCGPVLQVSGVGGWQNVIEGNLFFNSITYRKTVTGISSDTVTFSSSHNYETGSPIEFVPGAGGSISPELTIGRPYWAIRISSTQVKVAASYENALAGTALTITAGSGTYYGWHGYSSGLDVTWLASKNAVTGNRFDQHEQHGISLYAASQNTIIGNLCNFNQYNTQLNAASAESAAGIALLGSCSGNVIGFNDVSYRVPLYPQDYGVLETGANTANVISQNSSQGNTIAKYSFDSASTRLLDWSDATSAAIAKTGPFNSSGNYAIAIGSSSVATFSATGLTVVGAVSATSFSATTTTGVTASFGSTGSGTVLDVTGGTGGVAIQRWLRSGQNTFGILLSNGWIVNDETSAKRLLSVAWSGSTPLITFGSASASAPVGTIIRGEVATGSNVAGSYLNLQAGTGTGNASVASTTISLQTPDAGASGSTAQTHVTRASFGDFGLNLGPSGSGTPIKRITFGTAVLVAGTVSPTATTVTANTRIFLTSQADGGTPGWLRVTARSVGANFTITSSSATDTSTVAYVLIEP